VLKFFVTHDNVFQLNGNGNMSGKNGLLGNVYANIICTATATVITVKLFCSHLRAFILTIPFYESAKAIMDG